MRGPLFVVESIYTLFRLAENHTEDHHSIVRLNESDT